MVTESRKQTRAGNETMQSYASEIAARVATMTPDQQRETLRVVEYIAGLGNSDDPTPEQLEAEDLVWDALFARPESQALLERLAAEAESGPTLPMFSDSGDWLLDTYTERDFEDGNRVGDAADSSPSSR